MFKVVKVTAVRLINADGSHLDPAVEEKVFRMMRGLQQDAVLGKSPISDTAALRIVTSLMERFYIGIRQDVEFSDDGTLSRVSGNYYCPPTIE